MHDALTETRAQRWSLFIALGIWAISVSSWFSFLSGLKMIFFSWKRQTGGWNFFLLFLTFLSHNIYDLSIFHSNLFSTFGQAPLLGNSIANSSTREYLDLVSFKIVWLFFYRNYHVLKQLLFLELELRKKSANIL